MNEIVFLLSKDCMPCESLPVYGNTYWKRKTPNIDELAAKGTIFRHHYTAGASTAMAMSAMLSGHYPYEFESRKIYINVKPSEFPSIFDTMQQEGYECHIIWDAEWMDTAWRFTREFGDESKTVIHNLDIAQPTCRHPIDQPLVRDDKLLQVTFRQIEETLQKIDMGKKQFIWLHLPHILKGRRSYMDDMDAFDHVVGFVRSLVGDDNLFITSDHGHMNLHKGKFNYGFDVYEPVIRIPLITPRLDGLAEVEDLTSNVDLPDIITKRRVKRHEYVISETTYYAQPLRKTAIVTERFKYIYNKKTKTEELYDLKWDPLEDYNILRYTCRDPDRNNREIICDELYFYPYREEALKELPTFQKIRESFWREAPRWYVWYGIIRKKFSFIKKWFR